MGVEVTGLNQAIKGLVASGADLGDIRAGFRAISERALGYALQYAPVRSGRLKRSLKASTRTRNKAVIRAGSAKVEYAARIHWGDKKHHIQPSLYLKKADDKIRPQVVPLLEEAIEAILKKEGLT